jgi:transcriptional regulator with XRE-family HTH domain
MYIGNIVKKYRADNKISLREFAEICGVSHGYIGMLESGKNSKTGEPIIPTIAMMKKIAHGLGLSVNELIAKCDDMPVSLSDETKIPEELKLSEEEEEILQLIKLMPAEMKAMYKEALRAALKSQGLI